MNELTLTELDMGVTTPRILGASQPSVDHRGTRTSHRKHSRELLHSDGVKASGTTLCVGEHTHFHLHARNQPTENTAVMQNEIRSAK